MIAYIEFETTAPTDDCLDPESRKIFAVSHVRIFAFHTDLDINRVFIEGSFGHSREELLSLNYLSREQLNFNYKKTLQLRDCVLVVADKKSKTTISEMFDTELKFFVNCLLKWFNKKFKSNNLELSNVVKLNIRLIGHQIAFVFVLFLLRLNQHCAKQMRKKCPTQTLLFSRNINFEETSF